jgi:hypothetical protein
MIHLSQEGTYTSGDTIRAVLRFRWEGEFEAVKVELHRTTFGGIAYGNYIVLLSRNYWRVVEQGESNILVKLEGLVPDSVRPGTYGCKYVRCFVPKRGWVILFENLRDVSFRVRREEPPAPPPSEPGAEFLALEVEP